MASLVEQIMQQQAQKNPVLAAKQARLIQILKNSTKHRVATRLERLRTQRAAGGAAKLRANSATAETADARPVPDARRVRRIAVRLDELNGPDQGPGWREEDGKLIAIL